MKKIIILIAALFCFQISKSMAQTEQTDSLRKKKIFVFVEQKPEFPGGESAMLQYISSRLIYPKAARNKGIEGRVIVTFVVNIDGSMSDIKILHDIGYGCGDAVVAVLEHMPLWKPAKQNGVEVRYQFNLPVSFKLK